MENETSVERLALTSDQNTIATRPVMVSVICLVGIALAVGNISFRTYGILASTDDVWFLFDCFAILSSIIDLISFSLILKMKKVGVYCYVGSTVFSHLLLIYFQMFSLAGAGFQTLVVIYLLIVSKKWKAA